MRRTESMLGKAGKRFIRAGLLPTVVKLKLLFAVDGPGRSTAEFRFLITDHGVANPSGTGGWSATSAPVGATSDPGAYGPPPEATGEETLAAVPGFFKAIFWSLLLFVAVPALVIFGIYWLIWK